MTPTLITAVLVAALAYPTIAGLCYGWLRRVKAPTPPEPLPESCPQGFHFCKGPSWQSTRICVFCHNAYRNYDQWSPEPPKWILPAALTWPLWPLATPVMLFKRAARLSLPTEDEV